MDIGININETTLEELKRLQQPLSSWLLDNTTRFEAAAIILQAVLDKTDEIEERLQNEE
jgi:hypothetical protein